MKRQEKYSNTDTFCYYNANPKNRITADCAIRAIAAATEIPYNDVVLGLAKVQCETGYEPTTGKGLDIYMDMIGWVKHSQPKKVNNKKYTGHEFCKMLQDRNDMRGIVCNIGGHHMAAIKQGKIHDIWDCTYKCIGNWWTKKGTD